MFVQLFWGLLFLSVGLFKSIEVDRPRRVIFERSFYYPATCVAASFAIGLSDVRPEMFRSLRRLLLTVLRWLTVLAAAIVILFLATLVGRGVEPLWKTRFAAAGLIGLSLALVTLYNTVYGDGSERDAVPVTLGMPVRAALLVGPALAVLAYWALAIRIGQHGLSEDRLQALVVVTILTGFLVGYWVVALLGRRAPFDVRHVNVVMALAIVATLLAIHSPIVDLKRIAAGAQLARLRESSTDFDYRYLRLDLGRHGLIALQALADSESAQIANPARTAMAEPNRPNWLFGHPDGSSPLDKQRFLARIADFPEGRQLPDDLADRLFAERHRTPGLWCIENGPACVAVLVDLDDDGQEEVVVPLTSGYSVVYAHAADRWRKVGQLIGRFDRVDDVRTRLGANPPRALEPPRYHGIAIGNDQFVFAPCSSVEGDCTDSPTR